jgi:hypothetical protein
VNPTAQDLTLAAIANGSASVIYSGELAATPRTPAYFGFDQLLNPGTEYGGWPLSDFWTFWDTDQELWIVSPQANPVDVRIIEVVRQEVP